MKKFKKLILTITVAAIVSQVIMSVSYATTATVITETLRVRKLPTTDANILRSLDAGDEVEIISKEGDWYKISFNGNEGYIAADYVKVNGDVPSTTDENNQPVENNTVDNPSTNENYNGDATLKSNTSVYILPVLISSEIKTVEERASIKIIEILNNWSNIEIDGVTGWVLNKYIENFEEIKNSITPVSNQPAEEPQPDSNPDTSTTEPKIGYVNVTSANVRAEASTESEVVKTLVLNNEVKILEDLGDWYKIENGEGTAYIYANLVSDEKTQITSRSSSNRKSTPSTPVSSEKSAELIASASGNSVAEYAKQYIGHSYAYGGSGPTSFDCSGFTMYVFKQFGINLPHNAVTQSNYGSYVSKDNLVPGDLVIFNDYSNTSIGHSAIYIGNGRIVHAANSSRGVTTDTILSGYYDLRFVEGRRIL